jgi:hypothetical protein
MNDIVSMRKTGPLEPFGAVVGAVGGLDSAVTAGADFFFVGKKKF